MNEKQLSCWSAVALVLLCDQLPRFSFHGSDVCSRHVDGVTLKCGSMLVSAPPPPPYNTPTAAKADKIRTLAHHVCRKKYKLVIGLHGLKKNRYEKLRPTAVCVRKILGAARVNINWYDPL